MNTELIERVRRYALGMESRARFLHSQRTAETAEKFCKIFHIESDKGFFVGIAHDMCKEMYPRLQLSLASRDGMPILDIEKEKPSLLHGRAAASVLKHDFNVADEDILEAVRVHTFGSPGMCDLAKILYVADKVEPGRQHVTESYLNHLFSLSLNEMVLFVLKENLAYLEAKHKTVAPVSRQLLASLEEQSGR